MGQLSRILIVDDDDDIRDVLVELLGDEGFLVDTARNGQEALDRLRDKRQLPCVVLLDLMMPVMDGRTFLSIIKRDPALVGIPVIVMTAGGDCSDLRDVPAVRECLGKPVSFDRLVSALRGCTA